jgi:hypothetical protein
VPRRINILPTLVMALEMQAGRRDDTEQALQRRKRHRGAANPGQTRRLATQQLAFELRRHTVRVGGNWFTQCRRPFRQVKNIAVTFGRRPCRKRRCHDGASREKALPQKITAPCRNSLDLLFRQEVFRCRPQTSRILNTIHHSDDIPSVLFTSMI